MYASYRKIRCAGDIWEERLGYECQGKIDGERCSQGRVKAEVIFDTAEAFLNDRSGRLTKKRYQKYLLALHLFTKKKRDRRASETTRINNCLRQATGEKRRLVMQRAEMISQKLFDKATEGEFQNRIQELTNTIEDLNHEKKANSVGFESHAVSFHRFLELRRNLGLYWKTADYSKKAIFSKIVFWNLETSV